METAGYSGTPLIKKLGIKDSMKVKLINAPDNYFQLLEKDINAQLCTRKDSADFLHLFLKNRAELDKEMKTILKEAAKNKNLVAWISWYKKSAGISTDVTEDVIRNNALKNGLVDIKVCAVSTLWSGLKLVVPVKDR